MNERGGERGCPFFVCRCPVAARWCDCSLSAVQVHEKAVQMEPERLLRKGFVKEIEF